MIHGYMILVKNLDSHFIDELCSAPNNYISARVKILKFLVRAELVLPKLPKLPAVAYRLGFNRHHRSPVTGVEWDGFRCLKNA